MLRYAKTIKLVISINVILFMLTGLAYACGPWFDEAYLIRGSEEQFLSIPEGHFLYELERIVGYKKEKPKNTDKSGNTADKDVLDLEKALNRTKLSLNQKKKALATYAEARSELLEYLKTYSVEKSWIWYGGSFRHHEREASRKPFSFSPSFKFAEEMPKEFTLYMNGAVAYHNNNFKLAIKSWEKILTLPKNKRQYKTIWAAFMIGKAYLSMRKTDEAIKYFTKAQEFANEGYEDSLNLAYESYGWQALAEYENKDYAASIKHYLKQLDVNSLNWVCRKAFALDDSVFEKVVRDEISRKVLIGWVVSKSPWTYWHRTIDDDPNKNIYNKLLKVVEKIERGNNIDSADRIAWVFYNNGDFENTKKWINLANKDSALAQWIESKLLLREGKIEEALAKIKGVIPLFEKNQEWNMFAKTDKNDIERTLNTEIGVLQLRRQEYLRTLETLINGGAYWEDIAYVAEKVLTTKELEDYLYKGYSKGLSDKLEWVYPSNLEEPTIDNAIKYLIARRFARENNWQKALEYMPTSFKRDWDKKTRSKEGYMMHEQKYETFSPREKLEELQMLLVKAKDEKASNRQRAKSYYEAGVLMRKYGMEIVGTELDPDWFVFNGQFAYDATTEQRFGIMPEERKEHYKGWYDERIEEARQIRKDIQKKRNFFVGSQDEEKRVIGSLPDPARRFHYRFKAADLMWESAKLLPNNDQLKAKALCIGGSYIKVRDPKLADKFYKELVITCGKTELGQKADKLKWFPKIEEI